MKLTTAQPSRHPHPTAKATALAYLMFDRPNLEQAEHFLNDFGLRTVSRSEALLVFWPNNPFNGMDVWRLKWAR